MISTLTDIETKEHIETVVNHFYDQVKTDELLAGAFAHVDWPKHLPIMYQFWSALVFETYDYKGNPFAKHQALPLSKKHFDRWLFLFTKTVDQHFRGYKATRMKEVAQHMATVFQSRMNIIE